MASKASTENSTSVEDITIDEKTPLTEEDCDAIERLFKSFDQVAYVKRVKSHGPTQEAEHIKTQTKGFLEKCKSQITTDMSLQRWGRIRSAVVLIKLMISTWPVVDLLNAKVNYLIENHKVKSTDDLVNATQALLLHQQGVSPNNPEEKEAQQNSSSITALLEQQQQQFAEMMTFMQQQQQAQAQQHQEHVARLEDLLQRAEEAHAHQNRTLCEALKLSLSSQATE